MRALKLLAALLLTLPALAGAQVASFVTMTGTNANYPAGTLTANFLPPANSSQFDYLKYHFPFTVTAKLNSSGVWSMSLADTSSVMPVSSQWRLQLCSAGTFGAPTCYQVIMAITCINNVNCSGTTLDLTSTFAAAPVPPGNGTGTSGTVTLENIFASPGSFSFQHNLNSIYNQVHCVTRSGTTYSPATWTDSPDSSAPTTNTIVTVPSAGTYDCSFSSTAALAPNFLISVAPTTLLYEPTMTGTQQPTFAVTQTAQSGYTGTATYSTIGLAAGMSGAFSPTTITGAGGNTLTVSFPAAQAAATTPFTISATDGTNTHTASPSLTVGNINSGLVECWAMTDGSGTTFADSCGTSNTETKAAGTLTWASHAGLPGLTATFDATAYTTGANQTSTNFDGTTPFSVTAWVVFNGTANTATIASTLNTASNFIGWEFSSDTPGAGPRILQAFLVNTFPSNSLEVTTSTTISNSALHYVAMTYDGSKAATGLKFYIDGVLATNAAPVENSLTSTMANTKPVSLGGRTDGTNSLNGIQAYVRIYNRVLSQTDLTNYFAAGAR